MKRAIIYARVSTVKQAEDGLPVESQIERCHEKARALGAVVVKVFRDDGISGRTTQRPAFQQALDYCDRGGIDFFVCWSTSRFARNRLDAALNKRLLEKMGVKLAYASQDFGESDDSWLTEAITEIIDEQYSRTIAKDTRRSMAKNAKDGFFNGGRVPYGYRAVDVGKRKRLEVSDQEAPTVRAIFRWYLGGDGCKVIAERLNEAGSTKRGLKWDKQRVSSVLTSRAVVGQVVFQNVGEAIVTDSHQPLVSIFDFEAVQKAMASRAPVNNGGRHRSDAIFAGMLRCGACGGAMMTETATGRGDVMYHYYNCRTFMTGAGCSSRRRRLQELDRILLAGILSQVFTPQNMRQIAQELIQQSDIHNRSRQEQIDALGAESKDVERRLRRLYETIEAGAGLTLADVAPRLRELQARQKEIHVTVERLDAQIANTPEVTVEQAVQAAGYFREIVENCESPAKVRDFLSHVVKKASIYDLEAIVEYWPERLAAAAGGSQCAITWLPELSSLRTERIVVVLPSRAYRRAA